MAESGSSSGGAGVGRIRPETGNMRFGDDWTGVFIRGDTAAFFAYSLSSALKQAQANKVPDPMTQAYIKSLLQVLQGCDERAWAGQRPDAQMAVLDAGKSDAGKSDAGKSDAGTF